MQIGIEIFDAARIENIVVCAGGGWRQDDYKVGVGRRLRGLGGPCCCNQNSWEQVVCVVDVKRLRPSRGSRGKIDLSVSRATVKE